ncbi:hypothetical protein CR513_41724, partial [Mucuna pruriens]
MDHSIPTYGQTNHWMWLAVQVNYHESSSTFINSMEMGENIMCKLNKDLHGLRQASQQWFHKFFSPLYVMVFSNPLSLFVKGTDSFLTQSLLQGLFKLKIIGDLKYFTGLEIVTSPEGINLCQFMTQLSTPHLYPSHGILFPVTKSLHLSTYADADWGSYSSTTKSATRFCVFIGNSLIS